MQQEKLLKVDRRFFIGVNYWTSHAGTAMWSDWRPEMVELDFKRLSEAGIDIIRVFPLWPDFQPITMLYGGRGKPRGARFGEERLDDSEAGRAGMSVVMMDRFRVLTKLADQYGIKIIVGLITGWMSGRLFVPPALAGKPILTDPEAIQWQVRFVRYFIQEMKNDEAIVAWDLGNECNEMGEVASREEAWLWTSSIANAIKSADSSRPLISGMHSLKPAGKWTMQDQGELTDILTTHPYPFWTEYADVDPIDSMRPIVHAAAENSFYADLSGKPCFAEEMGTMGPMVCSEEVAAAFARSSMLTQWAHGSQGLLWWCANDQTKLQHAPYDWVACEGELGLMTEDGRVKPALQELAALKRVIEQLPLAELPPRIVDAVCIINSAQDHWAVAYGTFLLGKQAGMDITFQFEDQPLKDANVYLLPSLSGVEGVPKQRWEALLSKVQDGADLYLSTNDGYTLNFAELTGVRVHNRRRREGSAEVLLSSGTRLEVPSAFRLELNNERAEVLASEPDGNPVFTKASYGKGNVYFLSVPIEQAFAQARETVYRPEERPYWQVYAQLQHEMKKSGKIVKLDNPFVGVTEHLIDDSQRVAVLVNYSPERREVELGLEEGWHVAETWYGQNVGESRVASLSGSDGLIVLLGKDK
ncbi:cellulase family glycosylhydrolase [Paenibacillus sp. GCM10023252]|uniref:cellulase family glycosylhydrolase n=1 Tax=Paenibacillus sp. GCM10023252 TaxID=3252649 RepID=UPI00361AE265